MLLSIVKLLSILQLNNDRACVDDIADILEQTLYFGINRNSKLENREINRTKGFNLQDELPGDDM